MKKIGLLLLVVVLALGALGVGYAMWDKTVYIDGTVNTGEVDATFTDAWCSDTGIDPGYDKDVGSCSVIIDPEDNQLLHITINNGYPCYSCYIFYTITNTGTVPVMVQDLWTNNPDPTKVTVQWQMDLYVGDQIDPGDSRTGSILIHVEQPADELATYYFDGGVYLVQWNEYDPNY
jgi:hypothetical protein